MPRVRITRRIHFSAAHRLHREEWSEAKNAEVFGACSNPNWHGHNYEMDVTVAGEIDPGTGFVYDLKALRDTVEQCVVEDVDHRNLNLDVDFLEGVIPSAENLAIAFWRRLEPKLNGRARLHRVCVRETERNRAEYFGPAPLT